MKKRLNLISRKMYIMNQFIINNPFSTHKQINLFYNPIAYSFSSYLSL